MASKTGENFAFMLELDFENGSVTGEGYTVNGTAAVENGALVLKSAYLTAPVDIEGYSFFNIYADLEFETMPTADMVDIFSINKGKMSSDEEGSGPSMDWGDTGAYKHTGGYLSIDSDGCLYIHDDAKQHYVKTDVKLEKGVKYNIFLKFNLDERMLSVYVDEQLAGEIEFETFESLAFDVTFMDVNKSYKVALDNVKLEKSYNAICAEHNYSAKVTPPECAKQGYTTYTCRDCGKSYVSDYVEATGIHTYGNGVEHDGGLSLKFTCTICGNVKIEPIGTSYSIIYDPVLVSEAEAKGVASSLEAKTDCGFEVITQDEYVAGPFIKLSNVIPEAENYGWTVSNDSITLYFGAFVPFDTYSDKFVSAINSYKDITELTSREFTVTKEANYSNIATRYTPATNTEDILEYSYAERIQNVLNTPNTDISGITGTVYYVSENGNDENNGLTPASAWKTLRKVNAANLQSGDAVLFERGGVYRAPENTTGEALRCVSGVTYGCFGVGNKPIITGSRYNYAGLWKRVEGEENIWILDFEGPIENPGIIVFGAHLYEVADNYDEITGTRTFDYKTMSSEQDNENVPHGDTVAQGMSIYGYELLDKNFEYYYGEVGMTAEEFDFSYDYYSLYVYYDGDLNADFDDIEIGEDFGLFNAGETTGVTIDGLCFKHTGAHCVRGGKPQSYDLTVKNCVFQWSGGSLLSDKKLRYGNAIEVYGGCSGFTATNNWIFEMFDTGITMQYSGESIKKDLYWENVTIEGNIIEKCYWGMEYWAHPQGDHKLYASNILIKNNVITQTANTWGIWQHTAKLQGSAMYLGSIGGNGAVNNGQVITIQGNYLDRTFIEGYSGAKIHDFPTMFKFAKDGALNSNHHFYKFVDNYFIQYSEALIAKYSGDGNIYFNSQGGVGYDQSGVFKKDWTDFYSLFTEDQMTGTKVCIIKRDYNR